MTATITYGTTPRVQNLERECCSPCT
jgi:hypothetical protein